MTEIYDQTHQMDFDGKEYRFRLAGDLLRNLEGRLNVPSKFAQERYMDFYKDYMPMDGDVFFEVECLDDVPLRTDKFYLALIFDEHGGFKQGRYLDPVFGGGGRFVPTHVLFFKEYQEFIIELAKKLPVEVSKKIKDFYVLGLKEFGEKEVKSEIEGEFFQKFLEDSGVFE